MARGGVVGCAVNGLYLQERCTKQLWHPWRTLRPPGRMHQLHTQKPVACTLPSHTSVQAPPTCFKMSAAALRMRFSGPSICLPDCVPLAGRWPPAGNANSVLG